MASKLRIVRSLDGLIDDSVYNSQSVEVKLNSLGGTIGNLVVLLHEVVEELDLLDMCRDRQCLATYSGAIVTRILLASPAFIQKLEIQMKLTLHNSQSTG